MAVFSLNRCSSMTGKCTSTQLPTTLHEVFPMVVETVVFVHSRFVLVSVVVHTVSSFIEISHFPNKLPYFSISHGPTHRIHSRS